MDENRKRILERLQKDPAAIRDLMRSQDGQTLMQALTRSDSGKGLQNAVAAAAKGDTTAMSDLLSRVTNSEEGRALVERISRAFSK